MNILKAAELNTLEGYILWYVRKERRERERNNMKEKEIQRKSLREKGKKFWT